jgi:glucose 1-dehydrogenase
MELPHVVTSVFQEIMDFFDGKLDHVIMCHGLLV